MNPQLDDVPPARLLRDGDTDEAARQVLAAFLSSWGKEAGIRDLASPMLRFTRDTAIDRLQLTCGCPGIRVPGNPSGGYFHRRN